MQLFDQFYKSWNFFTGCYTFDNFFQTEGNGQDSAEFIDFRKQLLPHSKQNKTKIRTTGLFPVFKPQYLYTRCDSFDNFFQTEGKGQDSAEFIDFRKQKENKCYLIQNYQTLSTVYDRIISKTATKRQQYEMEYIQD